MHDPLVSVVVPCFNQGPFLAEAIESVLAQTFPRLEIVVVEDHSTDGVTRELVRHGVFPRTRIILNDTNRGVAATRNIGIRAARGPYILPLDADDTIAPTFVARALDEVQRGRADVCYAKVELFGTETGEFRLDPFSVPGMLRTNLVVNTALYRKAAWAAVGGYSEALTTGLEDWDFWLSLLEQGNRFRRLDAPLFFYRRHGPTRTDSARTTEPGLRALIYERHRGLFERHGLADATARCLPRTERRRQRVIRHARSALGLTRPVGTPPQPPILLHYFRPRGIANFGDQLNVPLLETLTGRPVRHTGVEQASHLCIGSLLDQFLLRPGEPAITGAPLTVWGAGFIRPPAANAPPGATVAEAFRRPVVPRAVRGHLTLERLRAMGVPVAGVALGDPGLLAGLLLPAPERAERRPADLRVGLVPHYVDVDEPILAELLRRFPGARLLRVSARPAAFLARLRSCDIVLSSAMHGLIAADALGIPNVRMKLSDRLTGGDWKFHDYYSVFGVEPAALATEDLRRLREDDLRHLAATHPVTAAQVHDVVVNLLTACPFLVPDADAEGRPCRPTAGAAGTWGDWPAVVARKLGIRRRAA